MKVRQLSDLDLQWWTFHLANPHVYAMFDEYCHIALAHGQTRYSARAIFHVMRWHTMLRTTDPKFKINNKWSARYSRLWTKLHPYHPNFFERRELNVNKGLS